MRFLLTQELGRLAKWLRLLGYDTVYVAKNEPASLIIQALRDERIIVTRNHHLPRSRGVRIYIMKSDLIKEQVREVLKALNIVPVSDMMFTRCILCNEPLRKVEKTSVQDKVPKYVYETQQDFVSCVHCGRIYWQGTHSGNVVDTLQRTWSS